jgi:hypothetical protein
MDVTFIVNLQPQVHIQDKHFQFTHIQVIRVTIPCFI